MNADRPRIPLPRLPGAPIHCHLIADQSFALTTRRRFQSSVIMPQRLFFTFIFFAFLDYISPFSRMCGYFGNEIYHVYIIYDKIYNTKKRPTLRTQNECTTSAVIPLAPHTRPGGSEYIIKFINTRRKCAG